MEVTCSMKSVIYNEFRMCSYRGDVESLNTPKQFYSEKGIQVINMYDFLLNPGTVEM